LVLTTAAVVSLLFVVIIPMTIGEFSAQTTNPNNSFNAGTLTMDNTKDGAAIVSVSADMKPGDVASGNVTITNSGSLAATMTLSQDTVTNGGPSGSSNLAGQLDLVIVDTTTTATVYSGKFNALSANTALPGSGGAQWAAGEAHVFTFTVTFPLASGNDYQGTSASATFVWNGVQ
jgi:hypothetical protein